jgi:hypothetical protein
MAERDPSINWVAVEEDIRPIRERIVLNMAETGHPFHHRTRNGVIIDRDPRIDRDHLEHLWVAGFSVDVPKPWAHPRHAVRTVPDWYQTSGGRKWLKRNSTAAVVEAAPARQRSLWE